MNGSGTASRVPGTTAIPNTTVSSSQYNASTDDIYAIFNTPRPIAYGGTNGSSAVEGIDNLSTKGTDIASATTTDIGAATGRFVHITGTTTITGLGTKTAGVVRFVVFDGALTLTHNATSLILPGGGNIVTAAGDTAIFISEGAGNWRCVDYVRGASFPVETSARLTLSGGNLLLSRFNGSRLTIGGFPQSIPSAGVTLAATGTTATTLYYIYAFMNSGTMTLEASTTVPVADTNTGIQIKTGDSSRTLVGMARPVTGPAWADSATQRFVISYFNRTTKVGQSSFTAVRTTTSLTFVEINTEIRVEFLAWGDESIRFSTSGGFYNNTANAVYSVIGIDGVTTKAASAVQATAASYEVPFNMSGSLTPSVGYHYATIGGRVGGNTGSWDGIGDGACSLQAEVKG